MGGKAGFIRRMFSDISPRYDLLNTVLSFGLDGSWRKFAAEQCRLSAGGLALHAATGTAELSRHLARLNHNATIVGIDFSPEMLGLGPRLIRDKEGKLVEEKPYITGSAIEPNGSDFFVSVCTSGYCSDPMMLGTEDAEIKVFRSRDGGRTWQTVGNPPRGYIRVLPYVKNGNVLIVGFKS